MSLRFLLLLALSASIGCGSKNDETDPDASTAPKHVDKSTLPDLGKPIAGLDEGRLTISPPANWYVRKDETASFLVKFTLFKKSDAPLPVILVKSEDSPFAELQTVTEDELEDFAISMAEIVKERRGVILEKVKPMVIGGVPCIRYVKKARFKRYTPRMQVISGEAQVIQTLANGRLYTVEMHIREKTISKFRDQAYAVLASMQFKKPSASPDDKK